MRTFGGQNQCIKTLTYMEYNLSDKYNYDKGSFFLDGSTSKVSPYSEAVTQTDTLLKYAWTQFTVDVASVNSNCSHNRWCVPPKP